MATKSVGATASSRLIVAAVVGIIVASVAFRSSSSLISLLVGLDTAAVIFLAWTWSLVGRMNASATASHAASEQPNITATDAIILVASISSLVAAGIVMSSANSPNGLQLTIALASLAISWVLVHTVYMLRYARHYYSGKPGGIDFNQSELPRYTDFGYLAFTIGMTYQVSDNELQTTAIRSLALRQALISYLFGAVILAGVINLVVGLGK